MNAPPGFTWYDMLMIARYSQPATVDLTVYDGGPHWHAVWYWKTLDPPVKAYGLYVYLAKYIRTEVYNLRWILNSTNNIFPIRWTLAGTKCHKGKKPTEIYRWDPVGYQGIAYGFNYHDGVVIEYAVPNGQAVQLIFSWESREGVTRIWHPFLSPYLITTYQFLDIWT